MPIKPRRPEAYTGNNPYIFLSYRRKDSASMEEIVRCLKRNDYNVWYDEGLIPANEWAETIARRVENCGFFIALISQNYMQSRNCREELNFAWETERPCLLIYLEPDAKLSPGMRMHFTGKQFLRRWEYDTVEDMLQLVARNPGFERCCDSEGEAEQGTTPTQANSAASKTVPEKPKPQTPKAEPVKPAPPAGRTDPAPKTARKPASSPVKDFEYELSENGVTIAKYRGKGGAVVIPPKIGRKPVKSIREGAFSDCLSLTSIMIPDGATSIGGSAFYNCTGLTSVTIPNSIISIGNWAFGYCPSLTSVTIPNSVTNIGERAFSGCSSLSSITIPGSVTNIERGAFYGCLRLIDIYFSGSVSQWRYIKIGYYNTPLLHAHIHYNTPKPTASP